MLTLHGNTFCAIPQIREVEQVNPNLFDIASNCRSSRIIYTFFAEI